MKKGIHPTWHPEAKVKCACGNVFIIGSTIPELQVEVCSNCHPFYTGKMKFVDTAGRVDAFMTKTKKAKKGVVSKTEKRRIKREKRIRDELAKPDSLEELRKQVKKAKKKSASKSKKVAKKSDKSS